MRKFVCGVCLSLALRADAEVLGQDGFEAACGRLAHSQTFALSDGSPWPAPWVGVGGIAVADVNGGRGRLRPFSSSYTLARMWAPVATRDVEVRFRFSIEDAASQGVAFLVRHNGGFLNQTQPAGQGYGVFIEGNLRGLPGIGIWKEQAGVESPLAHSAPAVPGPTAGVSYRVRFRTHQLTATSTLMQAKYWPAANAEPIAWQVTVTDATAVLQNLSGGIGIDSASGILAPNPISAHALVDDIEVEPLCNPILGYSVALVSQSFQFTEGPLWRGDHLLFSDITGNTIYRLDPPSSISVFRTPSDQANGLIMDGGALLAGEAATRRISTTNLMGVRSTLVDRYQGGRFNSPNDMDLRGDGTLYFSDPDYGLSNPPLQRELPHNGLYRYRAGALTLEWAGVVGSNQPNGVQLSRDESVLFVTDTQQGQLRRWEVAVDGSLSLPVVLQSGLAVPDGMCRDGAGNIYVAVSAGVEIFAPDGARWGLVPVPRVASNCGFGDADGLSLYITARQGLYRARRP